jgi:serine-type D-Ala-D-Ala carboxypeptidase (penicillin-binding protein 5/6)
MKRYIALIIIGALLGLAYVFFIKHLIPTPRKTRPKQTIPQIIVEPDNPAHKTYKIASKKPHFGKLFNYRKAIWDNKMPVKGCKQARTGILVDIDTHKVLWAKDPREGVPIASMTKMMTLLLAFEALDIRSDLDLDTPIKVSHGAAAMGGSQVYLDAKETHLFGELLKTMAIKSANDSAYLVAEYLADNSMAHFIAAMNKRAYKLRMPSTHFVNVHGLTSDSKTNSTSSPEGLAILSEQLLQYPLLVKWTSTKQDSFRPEESKHYQILTNTNRLLGKCRGVDGIKTGYTRAAGFCITASCLRGGKRLVAVVSGFKSSAARNAFVNKLFDWGYTRALELENSTKK